MAPAPPVEAGWLALVPHPETISSATMEETRRIRITGILSDETKILSSESMTDVRERALLFHASVVADLLDALLERHLAPTRLTPREFEIATVLRTRGPLPPGEIATVTGVPAPSVSRVLGRMEAARLVAVADNPTDRRSRIFSLTKDGTDAFAEAQAAFDGLFGAVAARLASGLPVVDASVLHLEWALRSVAGVEVPEPLASPSATSHVLHYAGPPLRLDEEAEVLDYIDWLRQRAQKQKLGGA